MTRRPTRLSDADRQLWAKVTESIAPLEEKKANLGDLMRSAAPAPQEAAPARLARPKGGCLPPARSKRHAVWSAPPEGIS